MVSDRRNGIYRGIVAAIAGLILVSSTPKQGGEKKTENHKAETNVGKGAATVTPQPAKPVEVAKPPIHDRPCDQGSDNRESDLCAQWKAADSASDAAWWAMVATFVTALGTFGLFWQIKLTREAVQDTGDATLAMQDANKIARAMQRPYIYIESIGWEDGALAGRKILAIYFRNFGQSPAVSFRVATDVRYSDAGQSPSLWRLRECDASDLFPQGKIVKVIVYRTPRNADQVAESADKDEFLRFSLTYRDEGGESFGIHETFRRMYYRRGGDNQFHFFSAP